MVYPNANSMSAEGGGAGSFVECVRVPEKELGQLLVEALTDKKQTIAWMLQSCKDGHKPVMPNNVRPGEEYPVTTLPAKKTAKSEGVSLSTWVSPQMQAMLSEDAKTQFPHMVKQYTDLCVIVDTTFATWQAQYNDV